MPFPVEIHFRDMDRSESIERQVGHLAERLRGADVERCTVTLSQPHRHSRQGRRFHVCISLAVAGGTIVISGDPGEHDAHEDAHVAVRDAFLAARRRLALHTHERHGALARRTAS